jgi:hypothetical protein
MMMMMTFVAVDIALDSGRFDDFEYSIFGSLYLYMKGFLTSIFLFLK